ncbi:Hsp70 family protein [Nocardia sp. NPDC050717]|uniref:Hsp70 family protein n=1 Tax=Nocardia sp. NPDC050717 TaxID=3157221 RepID=UPI0033FFE7FB
MTAVAAEDPAKPTVRTRRTALTFDDAGRPRIGAINEFASAVTDFADLSREPEPMVIGGRFYSATNLIAAVATGLIELAEPAPGVVLTYPAVYSDKQVALLGQALHLAGAGQVLLAPEPVAAAEWLDADQGPLAPGFVLVYDLGANSLDLTVLRVGPDWPHHPMIGTPVRCTDFGGKPLGEMVARYAGSPRSGRATQTLTSMVNIDALRTEHIRDTFPLVSKTVAAAGLRLADLSRILVVGGASRPPEVAQTLAELGVPLVTVADPGQVVAAGAAALAARTFAPVQQHGPSAPHVAVFSSAAVVSALAMSAMTVFGSPFDPGLTPALERFPVLGAPADALLYDMSADFVAAQTSGLVGDIDPHTARVRVASAAAAAQTAYEMIVAPNKPVSKKSGAGERGGGGHQDVRNDCKSPVLARTTYGDPASFINPLPFAKSTQPQNVPTNPGSPDLPDLDPITGPGPVDPSVPGTSPSIPGTSTTPGSSLPGTSTSPGASIPGVDPSPSGGATTGGTGTGTSTPGTSTGGTGTSGGGTGTGGTTSPGGTTGGTTSPGGTGDSGASTGGTDGGSSSSGASGGGTSGGGTSSGGTGGGGASGGGDSGGASGGGASGGGAAGGGVSGGSGASGGDSGGASGGASSGGATSGGASGGTSSGGASSGGTSGGASNGGTSGGGTSSGGTSGGAASGGGDSGGASGGGGGGAGGGGGSRR